MKVTADLAANVWKIVVAEGDKVSQGDTVVILESMKMEIPVESPSSGTVIAIKCREGDSVEEGQTLIDLG
jgi:acetyl-CoA carboxylase biotin carboxyl carrier protein